MLHFFVIIGWWSCYKVFKGIHHSCSEVFSMASLCFSAPHQSSSSALHLQAWSSNLFLWSIPNFYLCTVAFSYYQPAVCWPPLNSFVTTSWYFLESKTSRLLNASTYCSLNHCSFHKLWDIYWCYPWETSSKCPAWKLYSSTQTGHAMHWRDKNCWSCNTPLPYRGKERRLQQPRVCTKKQSRPITI